MSDRTARETRKHKTEDEVEKESPADYRPRGVVREKSPVFGLKTVNERWYRYESGRGVEKSGDVQSPMARTTRGKLEKGATRLKQKQDKGKHTKKNQIDQ